MATTTTTTATTMVASSTPKPDTTAFGAIGILTLIATLIVRQFAQANDAGQPANSAAQARLSLNQRLSLAVVPLAFVFVVLFTAKLA